MTTRLPLRFGRLRPLLWALGQTPHSSFVEVGDDAVGIRAGLWFSASVPRSSVLSVARAPDRPWSIGVHARGQGRWIVNGAASPIALVRIAPPAPARMLGLPIRLRELEVGVDPESLAGALDVPLEPAA